MNLTPEILEHSYELLRRAPPFAGWRLPHADDIEFRVTVTATESALFRATADGRKIIHVSLLANGHLNTVLQSVAHEMIHLRQFLTGKPLAHDEFFWRIAKAICRDNGWDVRVFG